MICKKCGAPVTGAECPVCGEKVKLADRSMEMDRWTSGKKAQVQPPTGDRPLPKADGGSPPGIEGSGEALNKYRKGLESGYQNGLKDGYRKGLDEGKKAASLPNVLKRYTLFVVVALLVAIILSCIISGIVNYNLGVNKGKGIGRDAGLEAGRAEALEESEKLKAEALEEGRQLGLSEAEAANKAAEAERSTSPQVLYDGSTKRSLHGVKLVQKMLNKLFDGNLEEDGFYGGETERAVRLFQEKRDIEVTGIVDDLTLLDMVKCLDNPKKFPGKNDHPEAGAVQPEASQEPAETAITEAAQQPAETAAAEASQESAEAAVPEVSQESAEAAVPKAAQEPAETAITEAAQESAETAVQEAAQHPAVTALPQASTEPEQAMEADEGTAPDFARVS